MNSELQNPADHGGGVDAAIAQFGGRRETWIDLSTGINPTSYPIPEFTAQDWAALPDQNAFLALEQAARSFWNVPDHLEIVAANGASAIIAKLPSLFTKGKAQIDHPSYNEHRRSFLAQGWDVVDTKGDVRVIVHPNNPTGTFYAPDDLHPSCNIIDESFCDIAPNRSFVGKPLPEQTIVLKSFGKFWGLAGLRVGFAILPPDLAKPLKSQLGPWAVSGPALRTATAALSDPIWATNMRARLAKDTERLDALMFKTDAQLFGGTDLFRLYSVQDAKSLQEKLAHHHIWTRIFPYSQNYIRLGLPPVNGWERLEKALG